MRARLVELIGSEIWTSRTYNYAGFRIAHHFRILDAY